jgi:hypothetical protein
MSNLGKIKLLKIAWKIRKFKFWNLALFHQAYLALSIKLISEIKSDRAPSIDLLLKALNTIDSKKTKHIKIGWKFYIPSK